MIYEDVKTKISYNKAPFVEVKDKECFPIPKGANKFTFNWRFEVEVSPYDVISQSEDEILWQNGSQQIRSLGGVTVHPNVETYIKLGYLAEIVKFFFLFFSAGALLWAWSRTFFLIKYGWDKK